MAHRKGKEKFKQVVKSCDLYADKDYVIESGWNAQFMSLHRIKLYEKCSNVMLDLSLTYLNPAETEQSDLFSYPRNQMNVENLRINIGCFEHDTGSKHHFHISKEEKSSRITFFIVVPKPGHMNINGYTSVRKSFRIKNGFMYIQPHSN